MTYGVCMCTCGPPPHGICNACGAPGPYYNPAGTPPPGPPAVGTVTPFEIHYHGPTEERIREIIREELGRALKKGARS